MLTHAFNDSPHTTHTHTYTYILYYIKMVSIIHQWSWSTIGLLNIHRQQCTALKCHLIKKQHSFTNKCETLIPCKALCCYWTWLPITCLLLLEEPNWCQLAEKYSKNHPFLRLYHCIPSQALNLIDICWWIIDLVLSCWPLKGKICF